MISIPPVDSKAVRDTLDDGCYASLAVALIENQYKVLYHTVGDDCDMRTKL